MTKKGILKTLLVVGKQDSKYCVMLLLWKKWLHTQKKKRIQKDMTIT